MVSSVLRDTNEMANAIYIYIYVAAVQALLCTSAESS